MSIAGNTAQNNFEQDHQKMNSHERLLTDHSEGCVFAVATEETNIADLVALRIQKILSTTSALPENIICFTGSKQSSLALLNQLENLIGQDAFRINICTFPAFYEKLIQEDILSNHNSLLQISTLESIGLFKKLIAALPNGNPLKRYRSDVFHEINNLMNLFSLMKREGLTVEHLNEKADAFLKEIEAGNEPAASMKTTYRADEKKMIEKLRAGINEFEHYQRLLQINNRYDAEDVAYLAMNALEKNQTQLSAYQQKCKYLLLDEYESISYMAAKLIQLLTANNEHPNILLISYPENALPHVGPIDIKYWPAITSLNTGKWTVVTINELTSSPASSRDINESNIEQPVPVIKSYHSQHEEMAGIVNLVQQLILTDIDPAKIAVLYQNDDYCEQLEQYFVLKKIPFFSPRNINILEHPFINKIIQLLHYIGAEQDMPFSADELLFEILHFDFFKIPPVEIIKLAIEAGSKKSNPGKAGIRKLLQEKANAPAKDLFDTGINKQLKYVSLILEKLITDISADNLQQVFKNVTGSPWVQNYIGESRDNAWLMQLLTALTDWIEKETTRNPGLQLSEAVAAIGTMRKEHLPITVSKVNGSINAVHLTMATPTEEIKFNYIFFAGGYALSKTNNSWLSSLYKLPETNFSPLPVDDAEIISRLLHYHVHSKNAPHLFISFAKYNSNGKESALPSIIKKIASLYSIIIEPVKLNNNELEEYTVLNKVSLPETAHLEEAIIAPILDKFVMSVSALNNYLDCPLGFYYKNIIRIPARKNEAMEFGSAVHYSLEKLFKKIISGSSSNLKGSIPGEVASAMNLVEDFKQYMKSRRAHFTSEAFERRTGYGAEILQNYYDHYALLWNRIVSIERNISGITINGVPVKGKLDKLEFTGKEVTIVDYKTGDIEKALLKMKPPDDDNPNGGDYWRQAVFYKLLVDNYEQKGWKVISTEFDFIEPDKNNNYRKEKIQIGPPDIETVKQQIAEVWAKIQRGEFYTGCGRPDCHWCNFVKDDKLAI